MKKRGNGSQVGHRAGGRSHEGPKPGPGGRRCVSVTCSLCQEPNPLLSAPSRRAMWRPDPGPTCHPRDVTTCAAIIVSSPFPRCREPPLPVFRPGTRAPVCVEHPDVPEPHGFPHVCYSGSWSDSNGVTPSSAPPAPGLSSARHTHCLSESTHQSHGGRASAVCTADGGCGQTKGGTFVTSTPASSQRPGRRSAGDRKPERRAGGGCKSATRRRGARSPTGVRGALELATDRRNKVTMRQERRDPRAGQEPRGWERPAWSRAAARRP